jgi:hypothetical protein
MAIRFVPKTAEDLKAEAISLAPVIAAEPISEAPSAVKSIRANTPKRKQGPSDETDSKGR